MNHLNHEWVHYQLIYHFIKILCRVHYELIYMLPLHIQVLFSTSSLVHKFVHVECILAVNFFLGGWDTKWLVMFDSILCVIHITPTWLQFLSLSAETITRVNGTAVAEPITSPSLHDLQIYGIIVTIILCFIVFGGVKMINRVAPAFLVPVLFSLASIFVGILVAKKDHPASKSWSWLIFVSSYHVSYSTCLPLLLVVRQSVQWYTWYSIILDLKCMYLAWEFVCYFVSPLLQFSFSVERIIKLVACELLHV